MDKNRLYKLDGLFEALSIIAEGNYVYLCDMKEDYSRWSKSAVDFFDLPGEYMSNAGGVWEEHIHPDDKNSYHASIDLIFSGNANGHDMQYRARAKDGSYAVCTCRGIVINDENGVPEYFGGAIKNHGLLSYIDNVTGLRSLYGFIDDLKTILWKKENRLIMLVGLSNFSRVNDVYGFSFGNNVLCKLGSLLSEKLANSGLIYRMDGTKFAVVSRTFTVDEIRQKYEELKNIVSHDFYVDGERVSLSLNAGAVMVDNFDISQETVYSCLKYAYYESKNKHIGEFIVFEDALSDDGRQTVEKLHVIRNSIAENCKGFYLCYQPIVNAGTEELKGMEALIRWKNDTYGTVPPIQFIPILEQDTIFPELGRWILRQAMEDGKHFLKKYPNFVMNVNLSYAQLEKRDFVSELFELLEETNYPPENLCLEITERCRLLDMDLLKSMFEIVRAKGIKIAIDDFGTGFASLGVLRELPVDIIKIDREYVKNIEKSPSDQHTVKFISELAQAFKADVCVEGVETAGMRDFLLKYSVGSLQGYYYSKPIPVDEFAEKYFKNNT